MCVHNDDKIFRTTMKGTYSIWLYDKRESLYDKRKSITHFISLF